MNTELHANLLSVHPHNQLSDSSALTSKLLPTWDNIAAKMEEFHSLEHLKNVYSSRFPEFPSFEVHRSEPKFFRGLVVATLDQMVLGEILERVTCNEKQRDRVIRVLELGCGGSHHYLPDPGGIVDYNYQPATFARALKAFFADELYSTLSDRSKKSGYLEIIEGKLVLCENLRKKTLLQKLLGAPNILTVPYLDPDFEKTIYGIDDCCFLDYSDSQTLKASKGYDIIFARHQERFHEDYVKHLMSQYIAPLLNPEGVIYFSCDRWNRSRHVTLEFRKDSTGSLDHINTYYPPNP